MQTNNLNPIPSHYRRLLHFINQKQNAELRNNNVLDLSMLKELAADTVKLMQQSSELVKIAIKYFDPEDLTISHAANVTILALRVAIGLGYSYEQLIKLASASLVHDIGAGLVPLEIVLKDPKLLTHKEIKIFEGHSYLGYDAIKQYHPELSELAEIVLQHHEKGDGSGYPYKLMIDNIIPEAIIISMVDVYEALIHPRVHRDALVPPKGIDQILSQKGKAFPPKLIKALIEQISIYPVGCRVELNSGEVAEVIETRRENPLRPVVKILKSPNQTDKVNQIIDLRSNYLLKINKCVPPPELPI